MGGSGTASLLFYFILFTLQTKLFYFFRCTVTLSILIVNKYFSMWTMTSKFYLDVEMSKGKECRLLLQKKLKRFPQIIV